MLVRHNTSLLEKAIELAVLRSSMPIRQAEADAARKEAEAIAKRRIATGIAVAIAAVGLGLGVMFSQQRHVSRETLATSPEPQSQIAKGDPNPIPQRPASVSERQPGRVDMSKFKHSSVPFMDRMWELSAGHEFANETDTRWKYAWCYTVMMVDGISVRIDLARRQSPTAKPVGSLASAETLSKVGLNQQSSRELATRCPWLDERQFRLNEIAVSSVRQPDVSIPGIPNPQVPSPQVPSPQVPSPQVRSPEVNRTLEIKPPLDLGPRAIPEIFRTPPKGGTDPAQFGIY